MQITLEQLEFLKKKAGLSYDEAMELMQGTKGDFLKAISLLEDKGKIAFHTSPKEGLKTLERAEEAEETTETEETAAAEQTGERGTPILLKILQKGKTCKIKVNRTGGTLFQIPLVLGIAGAAAFPRLASWGMLGLLLTRCSLELEL